ncbi:MAG: hypothetical protein Q4A74_00950 [Cardiobacteriaceae bacterium]|nr:hypothetical protein [Cardiobacteriaceae bacterium]
MEKPQKVFLVHGLFMRATMLFPLAHRLQQLGYQCLRITYPTQRQPLRTSVHQHLECIQSFAQDETLFFLGHSLGGLFLRHLQDIWPQGFIDSRVVTLGTPHLGSKVGRYFHDRSWGQRIIGHSWSEGLDGSAPKWNVKIPLLSIAGTFPLGFGTPL